MSLGLSPRPPLAPEQGQRVRLPKLEGDGFQEGRSPRSHTWKVRAPARCDGNADTNVGSDRRRQLELIKRNRRRRHAAEDVCRGEWSDIDCKRKWDELRQERSLRREKEKTQVYLERLPEKCPTSEATSVPEQTVRLPHLVVEDPCQRQRREHHSRPPQPEALLTPQLPSSPRLPQLREQIEPSKSSVENTAETEFSNVLPVPLTAPAKLGGELPLDLEGLEEDDADAPLHSALHRSLHCESPLFQWTGSALKSPSNAASTDIQEEIRCDPEPLPQRSVRIPCDIQPQTQLPSDAKIGIALATVCACGVTFIPDSRFCRMCGAKRPGHEHVEVVATVPVAPKAPAPEGRFTRKDLLRKQYQEDDGKLEEQVAQVAAATSIQSVQRAKQAKKQVSSMREQRQEENSAAITIQASFRGLHARKQESQCVSAQAQDFMNEYVVESAVIENSELNDAALWASAIQQADDVVKATARDEEEAALWTQATRKVETTVSDTSLGEDGQSLIYAALAENLAKAVLFGDHDLAVSMDSLRVSPHIRGDADDTWSEASSPYFVVDTEDSVDQIWLSSDRQDEALENMREEMRSVVEHAIEEPLIADMFIDQKQDLEHQQESGCVGRVSSLRSEPVGLSLESVREKVRHLLGRAHEEDCLRPAMVKAGIIGRVLDGTSCNQRDQVLADPIDDIKKKVCRALLQSHEEKPSADRLDDLKQIVRKALWQAHEDGSLSASLEEMRLEESLEECQRCQSQAVNKHTEGLTLAGIQAQMCEVLLKASDDGCLKTAIHDITMTPELPAVESVSDALATEAAGEMQKRMHDVLLRSYADGSLAGAVRDIRSTNGHEVADRLQGIQDKMHGALLKAHEDGSLHELLHSVREKTRQVKSATSDNGQQAPMDPNIEGTQALDNMQERMHEVVFPSYGDGSLAGAVHDARSTSDSRVVERLQAMKDKMHDALLKAHGDGSLHGLLSDVRERCDTSASCDHKMPAPMDTLEVLKKQMRDVLFESCDDGALENALGHVRSTPDFQSDFERKQIMKERMHRALLDAHEDGNLHRVLQDIQVARGSLEVSLECACEERMLADVAVDLHEDMRDVLQASPNECEGGVVNEDELREHTKREVGRLLLKAVGNGTLEDVFGKIQARERARRQVGNCLLRSVEDGSLEAVLHKQSLEIKKSNTALLPEHVADDAEIVSSSVPSLRQGIEEDILRQRHDNTSLKAVLEKFQLKDEEEEKGEEQEYDQAVLPPLDLSLDFLAKQVMSRDPSPLSCLSSTALVSESGACRCEVKVKSTPSNDLTRLQKSELHWTQWRSMNDRLAERLDDAQKIVDNSVARIAPGHVLFSGDTSPGPQNDGDTFLTGDWIRERWEQLRHPENSRPSSSSSTEVPTQSIKDLTSRDAFHEKMKLIHSGYTCQGHGEAEFVQPSLSEPVNAKFMLSSSPRLLTPGSAPPPPNFTPPMCPIASLTKVVLAEP